MKDQNKKPKGWHEEKVEVLTEKGIEQKAPIHRKVQIKDKYSNTLRVPFAMDSKEELPEKIIDEVQSKRKPGAIARDNSKTAVKVGDKEDQEDVAEWAKNPGKSDLEDVDTDEAD